MTSTAVSGTADSATPIGPDSLAKIAVSATHGVRDNVGFGAVQRPVDDAGIRVALGRSRGGDGLLHGCPDGLDTDLGREQDGGAGLSGGQWQPIALARTCYRDGRLLILDEPSAPLDPLAELDLIGGRAARSPAGRFC